MLRCDRCGVPAASELSLVKQAVKTVVPVGRVRCPSCVKAFGHISLTSVTVHEGPDGGVELVPNPAAEKN